VDRKKKKYLGRAFNVYPNEVENVIRLLVGGLAKVGSESDGLTQNLLKKVVAYVVTKE